MAGSIEWIKDDEGNEVACAIDLDDGSLYVGGVKDEPGIFMTFKGHVIAKIDDADNAFRLISALSTALLASRFRAMGLGTRRRRRKTGGDDAS